MNERIKKLCVISGGVLEYDGQEYYGKSAVIAYLHEISRYFDDTYFFTQFIGKPNLFCTKLDKNLITPIELNYSNNVRTFFCYLSKLIEAQLNLFRILTKDTAVLVFYPSTWGIFSLPLICIRSGRYIAYFATDLDELVKMTRGEGGIRNLVKSLFYVISQRFSIVMADAIITRGKKTYEKVKKRYRKVFESKPIISLTKEDSYLRDDTCKNKIIQLLYVGGLYERKGLPFLLEALSALSRDPVINGKIHLKIAGAGSEETKLKELTRKLVLEDYIEFLGWIDNDVQLLELYRDSDIFVLPSMIAEGFPRVLDEATCNSLPIIATKVGSIPEELRNKKEAILVEPRSAERIGLAIKELISNRELRRRLIKNGRNRFLHIANETAAHQHAKIIHGSKDKLVI